MRITTATRIWRSRPCAGGLVDLDGTNISAVWEPIESGLRADPRFRQLMLDLKLVDYWRTSGKWGDHCRSPGANDFECR